VLNALKNYPITIVISVLVTIAFILFQPSDVETLQLPVLYPVKLIAASFLHVNAVHYLSNLVLWCVLGYYLEPKISRRQFITIVILAILMGGALETVLFGPNFVGLSGACYGLLGAVIWQRFSQGRGTKGFRKGVFILFVMSVLDPVFNLIASPGQIAYAAHTGGLMAGFLSSLGFGKGQGQGQGSEPHRIIRPMTEADIKPVLEIIYDHDEDDGEEAEAAFEETLADKYVMEFEGRMMGMTGFRPDPDTANTAWLSFTYIHEFFQRRGNAHWMMLALRDILEESGIERLFIATSDYIDEDTGEDIYLPARNFYENKLNARYELKIDDFYAPGESKYIYSLPVTDRSEQSEPVNVNTKARFVGLGEASESDTSYVTLWEEDMGQGDMGEDTNDDTRENTQSHLPTKSLYELIDEVKSYGGKALFVTLPDYISNHHTKELREAGFKDIGTLQDYFAKDIGEVHWGLYFD